MIVINAPIQQDKIIEELNNYKADGVSFNHVKKKGMKLYFETNQEDQEKASKLAKEIIQKTTWGSVLYFSTSVEKDV